MGRVAGLLDPLTPPSLSSINTFRMWRLASLLLLALASAEPQYGYLPPSPTEQECRVAPVTSVINTVSIVNRQQVVNVVNTQFATALRTQVVPTTVYRTQVQTNVQYQTSIVQQASIRNVNRVVTQTLPAQVQVQTQYVTSTQVVPQISYVVQTQVQTRAVPVERVQTQVVTVDNPVVQYQTQLAYATRVVTNKAPDVLQTRVQTLVQTARFTSQLPAFTRQVINTRVQQVVQTSVVYGQDVLQTSVVQRQQVIPFTAVNTRFVNSVVTSQQVVARTNVQTQTRVVTQVVPSEVVRSVTNVVYRTTYQSRFEPVQVVQTVVSTQYVTGAPQVRTQQAFATSVVQVPGQQRVFTQEVVNTQVQQQVVYRTVAQPRQVVVTQTVRATCGYNYDTPATPFNF